MWSIAAIFYCYEFLLQVSSSVMVPNLMQDFKIDGLALGNLISVYFYAYALMQIPAGILLDKLGPRRLLSLATLICAIGTLIFATAHQLDVAIFGRICIGLGSAFAAIGCMHIAAMWMPINRFALLTGITLTLGSLGAVLGQAPMSLLINTFGWRDTLILFGIIGIFLAAAILLIIKDRSLGQFDFESRIKQLFAGIYGVLKSSQSWLIAIYAGLMYAPTTVLGALWGVSFLISAYDIKRSQAALVISFLFIGWAFGAPLWGWLSDRMGRRKPPMVIGGVGALASLCLLIYSPHHSLVIETILLTCFGLFSSSFLPGFSVIRENNPKHANATSLGFMNMLNMLGGAIAQPIIGHFLDLHWHGKMENGARIYSLTNYHFALIALPICIIIALVILFFVKETFCQYRTADEY